MVISSFVKKMPHPPPQTLHRARIIALADETPLKTMKNKNQYRRPFASALIALGTLTSSATGAVLVTISDNGTDLSMTAVGTIDLTGFSPSTTPTFNFLAVNAGVAPTINEGVYGWETDPSATASDEYIATTVSGSLTGTGGAFPATSVTAPFPFWVAGISGALYLPTGAPVTSSVNNTATFAGVTLASIGMFPGESQVYTFGQETVTFTTVVPEPSSSLLLGFAGLGLISRRKRK